MFLWRPTRKMLVSKSLIGVSRLRTEKAQFNQVDVAWRNVAENWHSFLTSDAMDVTMTISAPFKASLGSCGVAIQEALERNLKYCLGWWRACVVVGRVETFEISSPDWGLFTGRPVSEGGHPLGLAVRLLSYDWRSEERERSCYNNEEGKWILFMEIRPISIT